MPRAHHMIQLLSVIIVAGIIVAHQLARNDV